MLTIPDEVLDASHLSEEELKKEIAIMLYAQRKLSLGKARSLAGMSYEDFNELLFQREIPHYDVEDLQQDIETLKRLKRL
ncbi:MAG TPA: UPF0175 family protein [Chitinophagales bacterium]|nr:UPF0175 family protein [Chitinophagales bacterium]